MLIALCRSHYHEEKNRYLGKEVTQTYWSQDKSVPVSSFDEIVLSHLLLRSSDALYT